MQVRTTAIDLARWLDQSGGVWTVEGEPSLVQSLPVPAPAGVLADALRKRPGELVLLAPETCELPDESYAGPTELRNAAHDIDGHRVFQLAWIGPEGQRDSWLLAEHAVLLSGNTPSDGGRSAAAILDMLQKGSRVTVPRMRKG